MAKNSSLSLQKTLDPTITFSSPAWLSMGATIFSVRTGTLLVNDQHVWFTDENGKNLFSLELSEIKQMSFPFVGCLELSSATGHVYKVTFAHPFKLRWSRGQDKTQPAYEITKQWAAILQPNASSQLPQDFYVAGSKTRKNIIQILIVIFIVLVILKFVLASH